MKTLTFYASLIILSLILSACSSAPKRYIPPESVAINHHATSLSNEPAVIEKLEQQYSNWKGTPYQWGGLSKKGVDCSGFVYITYRQALGHDLPRSTQLQAVSGNAISRDNLQAGDLVFFKTSKKVRHVGIYIDNDNFLHASTSKGVMISSLSNPYWDSAYWQAKRI
jgi:lipoprotein Spr/probable lipoprotein NlpC